MSSRTSNSAKNVSTSLFGQVLAIALNFAVRTVFIYTLTESYLGINGLLSSILSVLTLTDLGLANVMVYALFKPMAERDVEKAKSLLRFYRNAFRTVGLVFFALGMALLPFLPYLAKGSTDLVDLKLVYFLYVLDTLSSYLFFAYMQSVPNADQKSYRLAGIHYISEIATAAVRCLCLLLFRKTPALSFYVYAGVGVLSKALTNIVRNGKIRRLYPWTKDREVTPLAREDRNDILKNAAGITTSRICSVLNDGIDSTIVSALVGLAETGIFSNYIFIRRYLHKILSSIFGSIHASIGNLFAVESREKKESFFKSLQLMYFWTYGFCAICLWMLYDVFITVVWHTRLLSQFCVFLLVFNFLIEGIAGAAVKYRDVAGMYWKTRYRYIISSVFNAVISVVLTGPLHMGVAGALLGTTASLVIMLSYDPVIVYRDIFQKKAGEYYRTYFRLLFLALGTGALVHVLGLPFSGYTWGNLVIRLLLCLAVPNGLWYLIFRKDPRFIYLRDTALGLWRRILSKVRRRGGAGA